MPRTPIEAQRSTLLHVAPEALKLITDKEHILYDSRVELPYDENMVLNIMTYGVIEPVVVNQNGGEIEVVAGRGRVKATIEANRRLRREGKQTILIPIIPRIGDDANLYGVLISENEIRREDTAVNKAQKISKLRSLGYTVRQIADTFGLSRQHVENMLAIDNMSKEVKNAIEAEEITATAALELRSLPRREQVAVLGALNELGGKPTVSTVKDMVRRASTELSLKSKIYSAANSKPQPRRMIEQRLSILEENGLDNALQSKPPDFIEGFVCALRWVLGIEGDESDLD